MAALTAVQSTYDSEEPQPQPSTPRDSLSPKLLLNIPATGTVASKHHSKQPTAAELTTYGIKVREFAIEQTLPPIAPVYLQLKQIQPNPGVPRYGQDNITPSSSQAGGDGRRYPAWQSLTLTQRFGVTRQRAFVDLCDNDVLQVPEPQDSGSLYTLSQPPLSYDTYSCWQSQDSRESEEYIKTPILTPTDAPLLHDRFSCCV
jgi:hypothetical protein